MSRTYSYNVYFDWDFDDTFSNETARVISVSIDRSVSGVGKPLTASGGRVGRAVIELRNNDNRYSSKVTSGTLYSDIGNGKIYMVPVRITLSINGGSEFRIFTGICSIPVETSKSVNRPNTLQVTALTKEEVIRNTRKSMTCDQALSYLNSLPDEGTAISYLLSLVSETGNIDSGLYSVFPYLADQSILDVIWRLSASCGGYFFCDVDGDYTYKNATTFYGTTSLGTFDSSEYGLLSLSYDDINLSRKVTVSGSVPSKSTIQTIYTHGSVIIVPPNDDTVLNIDYSDFIYNVAGFNYTASSFAGTDLSGSLSITYENYIDRSKLTFTNSGSVTILITGFTVSGYPIVIDTFTTELESSDSFWTDRSVNEIETKVSSQYLLSSTATSSVAQMILDRQQTPLPTVTVTDLIYNGSLELLDRITLSDSSLFTSDVDIVITKIVYKFSYQSGYRLTVEGVIVDTLYPYIDDGYFVLGTNKLGSTDVLKGRMFY